MTAETLPSRLSNGVVLVVDDDTVVLRSVERALHDAGWSRTLLCADARDVATVLVNQEPDVILLDLMMPYVSGEELLDVLRAQAPNTPVIVVTALNQVDTAVRCIRLGAYDYLTKPVDFDRLIATVARALETRRLQVENQELRRRLVSPVINHPETFDGMVTRSPGMLALFSYVEAIARSTEPVLVVGETGVGKELFAAAVHRASGRSGELVSVNVAGLDDTAFSDTLFGHTKGAFTGALQPRPGLVERAAEGTLFLDEIGDLKLEMQTKLLRLVQEQEYLPLGSDEPRRSSCRLVAATNRDLRARMRGGQFREDLYYRLHAHMVRVPPLRERREDIAPLVTHFMEEASRALGKPRPTPPKELVIYLEAYLFPGNVRELRSMVYDAVTQHDKGILSLKSFLDHMDRADGGSAEPSLAAPPDNEGLSFGTELPSLRNATGQLLREALRRAKGNQSVAARMLGISRRTMNRYFTSGVIGTPSVEPSPTEDDENP